MKRKVLVSLLILIIAIMCCGCNSETSCKNDDNSNSSYEQNYQEDDYEFDITHKKDKNDHSPVVYITRYGKRYPPPTCHHTKKAYMRLTIKQAVAKGYDACLVCCY